MVTLRNITAENCDECFALQVRDDQRTFVAPNVRSLAEAWVFHAVARPFAIYNDDTMVGFVMLDLNPYQKGNSEQCFLWRFMIDEKYQGKGYGKAALREVISYVKTTLHPKTLETSVVPGNVGAEKLYNSFGFVANGKYDGGEKILVLDMAGA